MKIYGAISIVVICFLLVGCNEMQQNTQDTHAVNSELINSYYDMAMENAVVTQHTLYPYHFVKDGAELNELGAKDISVLAKYFLSHPGNLNIRRGECSDSIYQGRVNFVLNELKQAGVKTNQMVVADDMPAGSGMPTEKLVKILAKEGKASSPQPLRVEQNVSGTLGMSGTLGVK